MRINGRARRGRGSTLPHSGMYETMRFIFFYSLTKMTMSIGLPIKKYDFIIYCLIAIVVIFLLLYMIKKELKRLNEIKKSPQGKKSERILRALKLIFLLLSATFILTYVLLATINFLELKPWVYSRIIHPSNIFARPAPPAPRQALPRTRVPPFNIGYLKLD